MLPGVLGRASYTMRALRLGVTTSSSYRMNHPRRIGRESRPPRSRACLVT